MSEPTNAGVALAKRAEILPSNVTDLLQGIYDRPIVRISVEVHEGRDVSWVLRRWNQLSVLVMSRGTVEKESCIQCRRGKGPFKLCVRLKDQYGAYFLRGSCGGCHYNGQAHACSLRSRADSQDEEFHATAHEDEDTYVPVQGRRRRHTIGGKSIPDESDKVTRTNITGTYASAAGDFPTKSSRNRRSQAVASGPSRKRQKTGMSMALETGFSIDDVDIDGPVEFPGRPHILKAGAPTYKELERDNVSLRRQLAAMEEDNERLIQDEHMAYASIRKQLNDFSSLERTKIAIAFAAKRYVRAVNMSAQYHVEIMEVIKKAAYKPNPDLTATLEAVDTLAKECVVVAKREVRPVRQLMRSLPKHSAWLYDGEEVDLEADDVVLEEDDDLFSRLEFRDLIEDHV